MTSGRDFEIGHRLHRVGDGDGRLDLGEILRIALSSSVGVPPSGDMKSGASVFDIALGERDAPRHVVDMRVEAAISGG